MSIKAFRTQCPICKGISDNKVDKTDSDWYYWKSNIVNNFFKQSGEENVKVKFCKHTRGCNYCGSKFETLEIAMRYIDALINSCKELQEKNEEQLSLIESLKSQNTNLQKKLNEIHKIAISGTD